MSEIFNQLARLDHTISERNLLNGIGQLLIKNRCHILILCLTGMGTSRAAAGLSCVRHRIASVSYSDGVDGIECSNNRPEVINNINQFPLILTLVSPKWLLTHDDLVKSLNIYHMFTSVSDAIDYIGNNFGHLRIPK